MHGGPIVRHLDDVPAEEMSRFRYADGRTVSIWEKWIEMSPYSSMMWVPAGYLTPSRSRSSPARTNTG